MAKRCYNRRSPEQIVEDLESEIARQKTKIESREKATDPVLKEIPKLQKRLRKFAQESHDAKRTEIANSTTAFVASLDRMYKNS